jgi:hypothetical protein
MRGQADTREQVLSIADGLPATVFANDGAAVFAIDRDGAHDTDTVGIQHTTHLDDFVRSATNQNIKACLAYSNRIIGLIEPVAEKTFAIAREIQSCDWNLWPHLISHPYRSNGPNGEWLEREDARGNAHMKRLILVIRKRVTDDRCNQRIGSHPKVLLNPF